MTGPRIPRHTRYVVICDAEREQNCRKWRVTRRRADDLI
jgi:hypothetical protein